MAPHEVQISLPSRVQVLTTGCQFISGVRGHRIQNSLKHSKPISPPRPSVRCTHLLGKNYWKEILTLCRRLLASSQMLSLILILSHSVEKPEAKGHLEGGCTLGSGRLLPGSKGPNAQVLFMGILEAPSASIRMGFGQERSLVSLQSWNGTMPAPGAGGGIHRVEQGHRITENLVCV